MASCYGPRSVFETDEVLALVMRDSGSDMSEIDSLGEGDEEMSEGSDDSSALEQDGNEREVRAPTRGCRQGRQLVWEDVTVFDDLNRQDPEVVPYHLSSYSRGCPCQWLYHLQAKQESKQ